MNARDAVGTLPPALTPIELAVTIDEAEVLRYLGMPPVALVPLDARVRAALDRVTAWASDHLKPRGIYTTVPFALDGDTIEFKGAGSSMRCKSADLARLLAGSDCAVIFAVTAGPELDLEVERLSSAGRLAEAALLDAVGSDCVEQAADQLNSRLANVVGRDGVQLTRRYSPGYGDLGLELQPALVASVHAEAIGVVVQPSLLMLPLKSVTAILGLHHGNPGSSTDVLHSGCSGHCADCVRRECQFRRPGLMKE